MKEILLKYLHKSLALNFYRISDLNLTFFQVQANKLEKVDSINFVKFF